MGQAIIDQFNPNWRNDVPLLRVELERIATEEWQRGNAENPQLWKKARGLLFGFSGALMPLWNVSVAQRSRATDYRQDEPQITGDQTNPSVFFLVRHFVSGLPIDRLVPFAAHIVLMGAHFNPNVAGLDMVVCRSGKLSKLGLDEIENLQQRSSETDASLARLLDLPKPA